MEKAFEEDGEDNNEEACELYMQAVELCLEVVCILVKYILNIVPFFASFFILFI